jgi:hypothetical protein
MDPLYNTLQLPSKSINYALVERSESELKPIRPPGFGANLKCCPGGERREPPQRFSVSLE